MTNQLRVVLNAATRCVAGTCLLWIVSAVSPRPALAQCSACFDCFHCGDNPWGGNSCNFNGPPSCPCREAGGNCNPQFAPIDDTFQAEWSCRGDLTAIYRQSPDGTVRYVAPSEAPNMYRLAYASRHLDSRHLLRDAASGLGYSKEAALGGAF